MNNLKMLTLISAVFMLSCSKSDDIDSGGNPPKPKPGTTKKFDVTLIEVHTDTVQGTSDVRHVCMSRGVAYIPIDAYAVKYSAKASGTGISWVDGQVWNWNKGENPGWFIGYGHPRGISDNKYTIAVSTLRQADGPYSSPTTMVHDPRIAVSGKVEVTVYY